MIRTFIQVVGLVFTLEAAVFLAEGNIGLSAENIAQMASTKLGSNPEVVRSLAQQRADTWIGFSFLIAAFGVLPLEHSLAYAMGRFRGSQGSRSLRRPRYKSFWDTSFRGRKKPIRGRFQRAKVRGFWDTSGCPVVLCTAVWEDFGTRRLAGAGSTASAPALWSSSKQMTIDGVRAPPKSCPAGLVVTQPAPTGGLARPRSRVCALKGEPQAERAPEPEELLEPQAL